MVVIYSHTNKKTIPKAQIEVRSMIPKLESEGFANVQSNVYPAKRRKKMDVYSMLDIREKISTNRKFTHGTTKVSLNAIPCSENPSVHFKNEIALHSCRTFEFWCESVQITLLSTRAYQFVFNND